MIASSSISAKFTAKFELVFILTQENAFSLRFDFNANGKTVDSSTKRDFLLGIFKIALRLRDQHVFM